MGPIQFGNMEIESSPMKKRNTYNELDSDPFGQTQPSQRYRPEEFEPIPLKPKMKLPHPIWGVVLIIAMLVGYFIFPTTNTVLVLGIDRAFEGTAIGRSDTNILLSVNTLSGEVKGISIPRDLWVKIPNYGENRINAAYYFGEGEATGNGANLAMDTLEFNLQIRPDFYFRVQLEAFPEIVDALGGVEITLTETTAGYAPGSYQLDGEQALAFVRDRSGTDDFFRMAQGQIFIKAFLQKLFNPSSWVRIPQLVTAGLDAVDTNIPLWKQPRIIVALLRSLGGKMEFTTISRDMVTPWVTDAGAQVLLPRWELIRPLFNQTFAP